MAVRKSGLSPNDKNVTNRIVEMLRAWNGEGRNSDEAVLTRAELREMLGGRAGQFSGAFREAIRRLSPGGDLAELYPGTQPPTQPQNAEVRVAYATVLVLWSLPSYVGHAHTEIWRNTADVLGDAVLIARSASGVYADSDVSPGTTYYYWVRHVNLLDKAGPWHATLGLEATATTPVGYLLQELTGQITEDQLYQDLTSRIDLIDTAGTGLVDRATALEGAQAALEQADTLIDDQIDTINAQLANIEGTPDWNDQDTYEEGDLVKHDGALWRAVQAVSADTPPPNNGTYWEKIGDYASLGDAVAAHAVKLDDHETRVTSAEGTLTAHASDLSLLDTRVTDTESDIETRATIAQLDQTEADIYGAEVNAFTLIAAEFADKQADIDAKAAITYVDTAIADEESARATAISNLEASLQADIDAKAAITYVDTAIADEESARATAISQLEADLQADIDTRATVTYVDGAVADEASARATAIQQVQAEVDGNTAAVQTSAQAIVDLDDETSPVVAQWTVKATVNEVTGGIGLVNDGDNVQVGIVANRLWVAAPTSTGDAPGANDLIPFIIDNGKVYLDEVSIREASIASAQIANLAVDKLFAATGTIAEVLIGAGHITNLMIGSVIQSDNFEAGSAGWQIKKDGTFEANSGTFRGTLSAGVEIVSPVLRSGKTSAADTEEGMWFGDDDGFKVNIGNVDSFIEYDGEQIRLAGRVVGQDYEAGTSFTQHQNNTGRSTSNDNFALLKDTRVARYGEANFLWQVRTSGTSNIAGGNVSCESYWEFRRLRGGVETVIDAYDRFDSGWGDEFGTPGFYDSGWISRSTNVDVIPDDHIRVYGRRDFSGSPTPSSGDARARNLRLRLARAFDEESIL